MNLRGDRFLARPGLAEDQHTRLGMSGDTFDVGPEFAHLRSASHQLPIAVAAIVFNDALHVRAPRAFRNARREIANRRLVGRFVLIAPMNIHRRRDQFVIGRYRFRELVLLDCVRQDRLDVYVERLANRLDERTVEIAVPQKPNLYERRDVLLLRIGHLESADPRHLDFLPAQILQRVGQQLLVPAKGNAHEINALPLRTLCRQELRQMPLAHATDVRLALQRLQQNCRRNRIFLPAPAGQYQGVHLSHSFRDANSISCFEHRRPSSDHLSFFAVTRKPLREQHNNTKILVKNKCAFQIISDIYYILLACP